jgi:hypothetical protein
MVSLFEVHCDQPDQTMRDAVVSAMQRSQLHRAMRDAAQSSQLHRPRIDAVQSSQLYRAMRDAVTSAITKLATLSCHA